MQRTAENPVSYDEVIRFANGQTKTGSTERKSSYVDERNESVAKRVATILDVPYGGTRTLIDLNQGFDQRRQTRYTVPDEVVVFSSNEAKRAGFVSNHRLNLLGGLVNSKYRMLADKGFLQETVRDGEQPGYWLPEIPGRFQLLVPYGNITFNEKDARKAAENIFKRGDIPRYKDPNASGGLGQRRLESMEEVEAKLDYLRAEGVNLAEHGIIFQKDFDYYYRIIVGYQKLDDREISYIGKQQFVDVNGMPIYAGSIKLAVPGDFLQLKQQLALPPLAEKAVDTAITYKEVRSTLVGIDDTRSCVNELQMPHFRKDGSIDADRSPTVIVEETNRIGGGTGAELLAHEAFKANSNLRIVYTESHQDYLSEEEYRDTPEVPEGPNTFSLYSGEASKYGFVRVYATRDTDTEHFRTNPNAVESVLYDDLVLSAPKAAPYEIYTAPTVIDTSPIIREQQI
jgi:hypothetical protein